MSVQVATENVTDLIEVITTWPAGMPVRAMERLLTLGDSTVTELTCALERWQDDESRYLLWVLVVLGELRSPQSIDGLVAQMRRTHLDYLAVAAAEALAKIGKPTLPALIELVKSPEVEVRPRSVGSTPSNPTTRL